MRALIRQIFRFGIVGALAFVVDYGLLLLLTEVLYIHYLLSGAVSFCVSTAFNYVLSVFWVFAIEPERRMQGRTFVLFIVLSTAGLGLHQLLLWLGTDILGIDYRLGKIGVTGIVMVYNYITRKLFLERTHGA